MLVTFVAHEIGNIESTRIRTCCSEFGNTLGQSHILTVVCIKFVGGILYPIFGSSLIRPFTGVFRNFHSAEYSTIVGNILWGITTITYEFVEVIISQHTGDIRAETNCSTGFESFFNRVGACVYAH